MQNTVRLAGVAAAFIAAPLLAGQAAAPPAGTATTAPLQSYNTIGLANLREADANADLVWQMRAGLNVAALQCQFSPFLATVPTYNALLRQHSDELANAFKAMTSYFIRQQGPRVGARAFDTYATRTNQGWATFDAQYSFCETAAMVGRRALAVPKGDFGKFAAAEMPLMRESLKGHYNTPLRTPLLFYAPMGPLPEPCTGRRCR